MFLLFYSSVKVFQSQDQAGQTQGILHTEKPFILKQQERKTFVEVATILSVFSLQNLFYLYSVLTKRGLDLIYARINKEILLHRKINSDIIIIR
jgi:hypothetical protein